MRNFIRPMSPLLPSETESSLALAYCKDSRSAAPAEIGAAAVVNLVDIMIAVKVEARVGGADADRAV